MSPRVTVLMPVFNREEFVGEAIESVIAQDFADFELLIVDDGSTDRTPELLRAWAQKDARIVVITAPRNLGIAEAPNLGLRHARTEYVARLDSDDILMPGRLAAQAAVLDSHPEVVLVSSAYETMDRDGRYLGTWDVVEPHEVVTWLLHFYNIVGGGGHVMFRRSQVLTLGGYNAAYPSSEDYDLWVRLLRTGRILTLPLIGMKQRDHEGRATVEYAGIKRANWTAIMRKSLAPYLGRPISDEEIAALITVWRFDGKSGMAPTADRTMREAFTHFRRDHRDRELRRRLRRRTARQWLEGARFFAKAGRRAEAMRYVLRAARWSPATVIEAASRRG
ncbi:MAG TPA: glycosyltransferase family A protein [Thermoanaerobaculia bacterium]|nr:glycosyltransferase family A protein [Thermoanaerobaculia bacterium]